MRRTTGLVMVAGFLLVGGLVMVAGLYWFAACSGGERCVRIIGMPVQNDGLLAKIQSVLDRVAIYCLTGPDGRLSALSEEAAK